MESTTSFAPGAVIIRENEISRRMYIIRRGRVRVYKSYLGQRINLAVLGEGEIFGELSFLDAEPRSASVEAITDVEAVVIDAETANRQISGLPDWILPVFKSVFWRLRDADQKMTVLQSINEVQRRHFKRDTIAETLYGELLRFGKTVEVVQQNAPQATKAELIKSMDELLGTRYVGLHVFWKLLEDYGLVTVSGTDTSARIKIEREIFDGWLGYLQDELIAKRHTLLSHSGFALLKKMVNLIRTSTPTKGGVVTVTFADLGIQDMAFGEEALKELDPVIVSYERTLVTLEATKVFRLFTYQAILKSLDPTISWEL